MTTYEEYKRRPIAAPIQKWEWDKSRAQPIQECGEELIPMSLIPEKILVRPQYAVQLLDGTLPEIFARESVFTKLVAAADLLPPGHRFVVYDCWRPVRVQQSLFDAMKAQFAEQSPTKTDAELTEMALVYVALPSTDPSKPSPHNTGGAIDLTIAGPDGRVLNMGGGYDDPREVSATAYFENKLAAGETLSAFEQEACENRRMFYWIMTGAGFTNYVDEWWHFDYGNQNWAWAGGHGQAIYGRAAPALPWNAGIV